MLAWLCCVSRGRRERAVRQREGRRMYEEVIFETERLKVAMWAPGDVALVHKLHSTIETTRYLTGSAPWSLEKCEERLSRWVEDHHRYGTTKYKLLSRDDDRFLGRAGFSFFGGERPDFELGYSLCQTDWGKGYATEIGMAFRDWFFDRKIANKFIAFTHPNNVASQNVLTKIGMRLCQPMTIEGLVCPTFEYTAVMHDQIAVRSS